MNKGLKHSYPQLFPVLLVIALLFGSTRLMGQTKPVSGKYSIYAGNTHSHTLYTWSHGAQWANKEHCRGILDYGPSAQFPAIEVWSQGYVRVKSGCAAMLVMNSVSYPGPYLTLKPDWQKFQGPPSEHYALAKAHGYDFYATTDHSQEAAFQPPSATNPAWVATKREAAVATDRNFVALAGFEYSENNGPGGQGHLNVINSAGILNALAPGITLPYLYKWLKTARPNGEGPVVVSFNHPGAHQYDDWAYRDPQITNIITMLEVINSNTHIHYAGFLNALDKGWKVSPVSGLDNHGTMGIAHDTSRTFVLATSKTKVAILDAMRKRRTYASLDENIQCRYTVNGAIMGSTLNRPTTFKFDISISDPDTGNSKDKITRIDIVKDGGVVVETYNPAPHYAVHWNPTIHDSASTFFFVRVWNAGGGDAPGANPANPVAWLAPVWTGR